MHTENITVIEILGTDLTVVNAARVSMNKHHNKINENDVKLLKYLLRHNHWTPFSHPQIQLRIKMPIFVARQWFKHQMGFTRNEVSRRYVKDKPEFYCPDNWRKKSDNVKQGSSLSCITHIYCLEQLNKIYSKVEISTRYQEMLDKCLELYENMINSGICAEQARMILPQAAYTEFYETGSLAAYLRLLKLRNSTDAQVEIQCYAKEINRILTGYFPETMNCIGDLK